MDVLPIRLEVIEERRSRRAGAILLARPVPIKAAAGFGGAVCVALGLLLGLVPGTVQQVELSPINDGAATGTPAAPVYRATVALSTDALLVYGKRKPFEAGMSLEADIFNDRRRLIEWVFDPLISAAKGAVTAPGLMCHFRRLRMKQLSMECMRRVCGGQIQAAVASRAVWKPFLKSDGPPSAAFPRSCDEN